MKIINRIVDWIILHILRRNCLNCRFVENLKDNYNEWTHFCENAINTTVGLVEPTETTICNLYKRKKSDQ